MKFCDKFLEDQRRIERKISKTQGEKPKLKEKTQNSKEKLKVWEALTSYPSGVKKMPERRSTRNKSMNVSCMLFCRFGPDGV